jgi:DNA-binding transcriptional MerR regulator
MIVPKKTLTIQEVSRRSGVSPPTLRFWEKALEGIVAPGRTKGGQRRYTTDDLLIIEEIKSLKSRGFSLTDIKDEFNNNLNGNENNHNQFKAQVVADKIARIVRSVIFQYLEGKMEKE